MYADLQCTVKVCSNTQEMLKTTKHNVEYTIYNVYEVCVVGYTGFKTTLRENNIGLFTVMNNIFPVRSVPYMFPFVQYRSWSS